MRIRRLTLPTAQLAALATFYVDTLGITALVRTAAELTLAIGDATLTFRPAAPGEAPFFHFAFEVAADSVEAAGQWFRMAGPLLHEEPDSNEIIEFPNWEASSVYLRDPADNIAECIGRRPLVRPSAAHPFTAADLHGLSEIGLVSADVHALANQLVTAYGLPYFKRQPFSPRFAVLGDDEGLLILVPPGRAWFPTKDALSDVFPLEIEWAATQEGAPPVVLRLP